MTLTQSDILSYFDQYGWKAESWSQDGVITGFMTEEREFTLVVALSGDWVVLAINPFVSLADPRCKAGVYQYLASLNLYAMLAKFSCGSDGVVVLSVELPVNGLTFEVFAIALETLINYAADQISIFEVLSANPEADLSEFVRRLDNG